MEDNKAKYIGIALLELLTIGLITSVVFYHIFGASKNAAIVGLIMLTLLLGFTPLINRFFVSVPKNCGAVIVNSLRTYDIPILENELMTLQPTKALREIGPGLNGIKPWESVGWVIDLGKRIQLGTPITAYSKDNIEVIVTWQVILTPLRKYLTNLVRHNKDTSIKFFEGRCRAQIIEIISGEYVQAIPAQDGTERIPSISEKITDIKRMFNGLFGDSGILQDAEKQFGMFMSNPQITDIKRSKKFQESVEALQIHMNNSASIRELTEKAHLEPNQALIAVLATQGIDTSNLVDVTVTINGLRNLTNLYCTSGAVNGTEIIKKGKQG